MHPAGTLENLRRFDTCALANAIERFGVRLRNEGFTRPGLKCISRECGPVVGYAVTGRVKSSEPPLSGGTFLDRTDWWADIALTPAPRIAVIEDVGEDPGVGAIAGEVHCHILRRLGCAGLVTNGAMRDVPALRAMRFPVYARYVAVSHSYSHMLNFGEPVTVSGLTVRAGDLLMADCHGVLTIPNEIAAELSAVAEEQEAKERRIIALCESPGFSLERLREAVQ
jgi:regulator of RNase E activity RraA